ncbi:MAG: hypothetical protein SF029_21980 [bacterium]|nr:hypothetical protein [bacterium]
MNTGFLNISWWVWGIGALLIAVVFAVFVPMADRVNAAVGMQFFIARWFHSLVWLLLAASFFMRAVGGNLTNWANPVAALGGVTYLIFLVTLIGLSQNA